MAHAKLAPSSAHRWMYCTASVQASEGIEDTGSAAATEGTLAHECVEKMARGMEFDEAVEQYSLEQATHAEEFLEYVRRDDVTTYFEQKVRMDGYVPECWGTADVIQIGEVELTVIDYKYGRGVRVSAENNEQLMLYALGAYLKYKPRCTQVRLGIYQPRINNISVTTIGLPELLEFAKRAGAAAREALSDHPVYFPSESTCKFCPIKSNCNSRAHNVLQTLNTKFKSDTLTNSQLAELLPRLDEAKKWIEDVQAEALRRAQAGDDIPGYKIGEGRTLKKWKSPKKAQEMLEQELGDPYEHKLLSPAQAAKRGIDVEPYVTKPPGKAKLVRAENDPINKFTVVT